VGDIAAQEGITSNRYTILGRLAGGGMADIFLARVISEGGVQRHVVLKRVLAERSRDPQFARMFLDEARLAAQLQHPNIAQLHDIGRLGGSYFFTMEYVHGADLRTVLATLSRVGRELPINLALVIASGALAALRHAHTRLGADGKPLGVVHRDVSPSNVMVSYEGSVKLLDFGVAKATQHTAESRSGTIKGKIAYLSPEQCQNGGVDPRSDLFSLGIVLHEMLVLRRMYRRDTDFATMMAIVNEPPPVPSSIRPDIPPELDRIVLTALAKDPAQRYGSAGEMLEAIETVAAHQRMVMSSTALGRFLCELVGERPEPWLEVPSQPTTEPTMITITGESVPDVVTSAQSLSAAPDLLAEDELQAQLAAAPALGRPSPRSDDDSDPGAGSPSADPAPPRTPTGALPSIRSPRPPTATGDTTAARPPTATPAGGTRPPPSASPVAGATRRSPTAAPPPTPSAGNRAVRPTGTNRATPPPQPTVPRAPTGSEAGTTPHTPTVIPPAPSGPAALPHAASVPIAAPMPHVPSGPVPAPMPHVPSGPMPHVPSGPMPHVPSGPMPRVPSGPMPHVPSGPMPHVPSGPASGPIAVPGAVPIVTMPTESPPVAGATPSAPFPGPPTPSAPFPAPSAPTPAPFDVPGSPTPTAFPAAVPDSGARRTSSPLIIESSRPPGTRDERSLVTAATSPLPFDAPESEIGAKQRRLIALLVGVVVVVVLVVVISKSGSKTPDAASATDAAGSLASAPPDAAAAMPVEAAIADAQIERPAAAPIDAAPETRPKTVARPRTVPQQLDDALAGHAWAKGLAVCQGESKLAIGDRARCAIIACRAKDAAAAMRFYTTAARSARRAIERTCRDEGIAVPPRRVRDPCEADPLNCRK